jgi:hypothetical protein
LYLLFLHLFFTSILDPLAFHLRSDKDRGNCLSLSPQVRMAIAYPLLMRYESWHPPYVTIAHSKISILLFASLD